MMLDPLRQSSRRDKTSFAKRQQIKSLALPVEHGVWGFWLEPSLLGLALAFSWAGVSLAFAVLAALLLQQPLLLYLQDIRRGKSYPRTRLALYFAMGYGALALGLTFLSVLLAASAYFLLPLVAVLPLVIYQFNARLAHQGRQLLPELAGVVALDAVVFSPLLMMGASVWWAFGWWLVLVARSLPMILYIRARLRLGRGEAVKRWPSLLSAVLAILLVFALVRLDLVPALVVVYFVFLFVRAAVGLSPFHLSLKPKVIGLLELGFGLLLIVTVVASQALA